MADMVLAMVTSISTNAPFCKGWPISGAYLYPATLCTFSFAFWWATCNAAEPMAFTGVSGAFTTPNALVAEDGQFSYQLNNFLEPHLDDEFVDPLNHVFTLGILPGLEIAGRLTDFEVQGERRTARGTVPGKRDLSANIKLNVFRKNNRFWFSIGGTDVAGLAQNFSTAYAVGTTQLGPVNMSLGAAYGDNPSLQGAFANATYRINRFLSASVEYNQETRARAGVSVNAQIWQGVTVEAMVAADQESQFAGLTLRYDLTRKHLTRQVEPTIKDGGLAIVEEQSAHVSAADETSNVINTISDKLADDGFERVSLSYIEPVFINLEFENVLFKHSDSDALAAANQTLRRHLSEDSTVRLTLLEKGFPKYRFNSDVTLAVARSEAISLAPYSQPTTAEVSSVSNRSWVNFEIEPALVTAIGTEYGTVDYSLAARLNATIPLWPGGSVRVGSLHPLADSPNFESGAPFDRLAWESGLEKALLTQYIPVPIGIHTSLQAELGLVQIRGFDYDAAKFQTTWQSSSIPLVLHARAGRFRLRDTSFTRDVLLSSAIFNIPRWQSTVTATYGQFFFGEQGLKFTAGRRFGKADISWFVKAIDTDDMAGGMQIGVPLGPVKGYRLGRFTLTGSTRWEHAVQTTISFPESEDNRLQPSLMYEPLTDTEIPAALLDFGRFSAFEY